MGDFYFMVSEHCFHSSRSHDSMNHNMWAEPSVADASLTYAIFFPTGFSIVTIKRGGFYWTV